MSLQNIFIFISCIVFHCFGGISASGGGSAQKVKYELITVRSCNGGESGTDCSIIRYYNRPRSTNLTPECYINHGEATLPCPPNYTKEKFVQDSVQSSLNLGFETIIKIESM